MQTYKDWQKLLAKNWRMNCFVDAMCIGPDHGKEFNRDRVAISYDKSREESIFTKLLQKLRWWNVLKCFNALCGQISLVWVLEIISNLSRDDAELVDNHCDWTIAEHWASWWMRPTHLKMLHKDFSAMTADVWKSVQCHWKMKPVNNNHLFQSGNT